MYNLSKPQLLIYDMEKYAGDAASVICGSMIVSGTKTAAEMEAAVNGLYRLNDAFRTRIVEKDGSVQQTVDEFTPYSADILRFEDKAELDSYAEHYAKVPLNLYGPLCEVKIVFLPGRYGLLVKLHHIIADAWTISLMGTQFNALLAGETPTAYPYADYLDRESVYLQSSRFAKDRAFFLEQFKESDEVTYFSEKQSNTLRSARRTFVIDGKQAAAIISYTKENGVSPFVLFMTALAAYMSRTKMNVEKFYIGTAILNRTGVQEKNTAGMFINTVPVLMQLGSDVSFAENLSRVKKAAFSVFRHQKYNYGSILADIRREYGFEERLYDVLLSYQNATITGASGAMESTWYHSGSQSESLQIHIDDRDSEGIFRIHYDYQVEKFTDAEIGQVHQRMMRLLFDAIADDSKMLSALEILPEHEKKRLLFDFNDTAMDYPRDKCIHTLFEEQTARTPDKTAVIACDRTLTYRELNEEANRIAYDLMERGVGVGDIVAFALPRDSHLIPTMFGILKAGAAYLPIDPDYPQDRISYMLQNSQAKLFITRENIGGLLENGCSSNPGLILSSESLCYCIYTSGSTGRPKGTLLKHRGLANLVTNLNIYHDLSTCERFGLLTTITFDVATQEIMTALVNGFIGILLPERKETGVEEIIQRIKSQRVDIIFATPTYFNVLTENEQNAVILLNALKVVVLAGEKFALNDTVLKVRDSCNVVFENQYGPVELHVIAAATTVCGNDFDSIGRPIGNNQAYILDKNLAPTPIGVAGELCIAGDGVGAGYLNRPELTAEKFIDNPFGPGKLYKTGDLAYWREDGNIVYVGRNDFQVKIRGLRIELGEIESVLAGFDGVGLAAVADKRDEAGRQYLVGYYTSDRDIDEKALRQHLSAKLPQYMVPNYFVHLAELPMTPSGKTDRKNLPLPEFGLKAREYIPPRTEQEKILCDLLAKLFHVESVGVTDNFFELGGDSLKAIELAAELERNGFRADVKAIFACNTVQELAETLTAVHADGEIIEIGANVPATPAQMRIYTAQGLDSGLTTYNIPYIFETKGVDGDKLQNAVRALIQRHEILRTRFENRDEAIMQVVEEHVPFAVECIPDGGIPAFIRPFDLSKAPLLRVGYSGATVVVDMHHIITDGSSMPIFLQELNELYMGRTLEKEPVQYRQFAVQKNDYTESEQYWLSVYGDELPELELNTDYKRTRRRSFRGAALYDTIELPLHQKILQKCKELNITPYVFYMSGFYLLLSKFSGNEDIVVGMPISGRFGKYLHTIGMFVNTVALRACPEGGKSVKTFLDEVKDSSVNAIAHQDYPYGELVKKLNLDAASRNPLFDVMFAYQGEAMTQVVFGDQRAELLSVPMTTSKYDFTFNVMPMKSNVAVMVEYCTDLYREGTMRRLMDSYRLILEQMLDSSRLLKDISTISEREKHRLLVEFNDTAVDYPRDKCVHALFEEQAARTPDKAAVIACDRTLTYRELNEEANRIAHGLMERGVGVGDIVAFALPRNSHLIPTMFGILKAGAAYLPIGPDYPQDRINYMLQDSQAKLFITEENIGDLLENECSSNPGLILTSENLCYCIYTSGSTGKPKGGLISHRNLINFCTDNQKNNLQHYISEVCHIVLACGAIVFDISNFEIVLSLRLGKTVALAPENVLLNADLLAQWTIRYYVDCIHCTPTKLRIYMESNDFVAALVNVKCIMVGGEELTTETYRLIKHCSAAKIFNGYGPTETTMGVCFGESGTSIGHPIANTQIFIVDKYLNPVPVGATGELCIAGDGVGAGYLNRPELTAEKFIDNPFGPGKLYKTGDLAYWREDGNIVYVGRNDFQVKIRGLRVELGEIENAIAGVNGVSQAVAVVRKDDTGRQLICAFYTESEPAAVEQIRSAIREKLPRYMMPHIFTRLDALPLTPSGKVNRKGLPEVDLSAMSPNAEYAAPQTPTEEKLSAIWGELLKIDQVGRDDDFFELGGDSLMAIALLSKLENRFDGSVSVKDIFERPVLKQLAEFIDHAQRRQKKIAATGARRYALLPQQMAIYAACSKNPQSLAYNMPAKFAWKDGIDKERLKACLRRLMELHPELKAAIHADDSGVYASYDSDAEIVFEEYAEGNEREFVRPFDLGKAPLVRVGFTKDELLFDIHHIIADGESVNIILRDLAALYAGAEVEKPEFTYADYAAYFRAADFSEHKAYFKNMLKCDFEPLILPEKHQKGHDGGASQFYQMDKAVFEKARSIAQRNNLTDTMVFLGAFGIVLSKFTARPDILSSIVLTNRVHREMREITGMFVNTLPVLLPVEGATADYLGYVRDLVLNLYQYQELPFLEIAEAVGMTDKNAVNTSFVYQAGGAKQVVLGETRLTPAWIDTHTAKFDLTFELTPNENGCAVRIEYNSGKYERALIDRLFAGYLRVINQLDQGELRGISVLSDDEYRKVIYEFNDTAVDYPRGKCVHTLFEEQAGRTPDKTAVIACDRTLTYRELNEEANRIAHGLMERGVGIGDIVAFALPRDSHLIPTMFGILKAGAAYLPIDPDYPRDRISYVLQDSQAKLFVTEENIGGLLENGCSSSPGLILSSENLCYCIYTSGSTGKPKGTLLKHRGIVNLVTNLSIYKDLSACERFGLLTTITFDVATQEIMTTLVNGFIGVLLPERKETRIQEIIGHIKSQRVDIIFATPTYFNALTENEQDAVNLLNALKVVALAGEKFLLNDTVLKIKDSCDVIFENQYGPVELHVIAAATTVYNNDFDSIGRPIGNDQAYILDKNLAPVPIGVTGELCFAGHGVGVGYLNRPELTAEKFIDNPFGPGKLYKTGDLAYWREDGNIVYVGRNDFQVKIRGLRIELGEIESVLAGFDGVGLAAVADKRDEAGRQYLVGYYTASRDIDEKALRQHLSAKLPQYMVPNYFVHLAELPMTPSGKTDRKNLPLPEFGLQTREYVPPRTEQEKILCDLLAKLFHVESVGITDNFFELGGDSLRAIEYAAKAHNAGVNFALQNVFDFPTVEALCNFLQAKPQKEPMYSAGQFLKYASILEKNTWNAGFAPECTEIKSVLLTGGTGFLGAHILDALMKHGVEKIYCLIRTNGEKLAQRLRYYFDGRYADDLGTRIIPVVGDLESERISEDLPGQVDYVIHAAASVKHYGSWQYFKRTNVDGTKHMIAYAQRAGAKLIHISTISVSGNAGADQMELYVSEEEKYFYESSLHIGQPLDNVYVRSKFEAEMLVLDAMLEGVQANIIRVGNLTNRKSDLKFQLNYRENAFLTRAKAMLKLGCIPDHLMPLYSEFSPVDSTAEAIVTIAEHMNDQYTVFHANSNRNLYFDRMLEYLERLGRPMEIVSGEQFVNRIRNTVDSQQSYVYEALSNDLDEEDRLQYDTHIHIEDGFTVRYLKMLGFEWPEIDYAYVEGYLRYFTELGYWDE